MRMVSLPHLARATVLASSLIGLATPRPEYVYQIFHDKADCTDAAVAVKGWVSGDSFFSSGGSSDDVCALEALCAINDTSPQCQKLDRTDPLTGRFTLKGGDSVESCDSSKLTDERPLCRTFSTETCHDNVHLPSCYSQSVSFEELRADPGLLLNTNPKHVEDQVYIVYYEDKACQDFVGFRSLVSGPIELHRTAGDVDCYSSLVCSVDVHSESCKNLTTGILATETLTKEGGREVWSCNSTGHCRLRNQTFCKESVIHPSCSFRVASGLNLFKDPYFWLSDLSSAAPSYSLSLIAVCAGVVLGMLAMLPF